MSGPQVRFSALYSDQTRKKRKTWKDGAALYIPAKSRLLLKDEHDKTIAGRWAYRKPNEYEEVHFDEYVVQIEAEIDEVDVVQSQLELRTPVKPPVGPDAELQDLIARWKKRKLGAASEPQSGATGRAAAEAVEIGGGDGSCPADTPRSAVRAGAARADARDRDTDQRVDAHTKSPVSPSPEPEIVSLHETVESYPRESPYPCESPNSPLSPGARTEPRETQSEAQSPARSEACSSPQSQARPDALELERQPGHSLFDLGNSLAQGDVAALPSSPSLPDSPVQWGVGSASDVQSDMHCDSGHDSAQSDHDPLDTEVPTQTSEAPSSPKRPDSVNAGPSLSSLLGPAKHAQGLQRDSLGYDSLGHDARDSLSKPRLNKAPDCELLYSKKVLTDWRKTIPENTPDSGPWTWEAYWLVNYTPKAKVKHESQS